MGLLPGRDRLCLVQLSDGGGDEHLVRFGPASDYAAPRLKALLGDPDRLKIYHFARFDVAILRAYLGVMAAPVYCTRTASRLVRTYTDRHGLKELVKEMLGQDISKQQQTSDWGAPDINDAQRDYAASDVRYLHALKAQFDRPAGARESDRAGARLLRLPAASRPARPCRLARSGYLRPCLRRPMSEAAIREHERKTHWAVPGSRHDQLVRGAKVALPSAVGVLIAFLALAPLDKEGDVSFILDKNKVDSAPERMRVEAARYTGQDDKGQRFEIVAQSAVQQRSRRAGGRHQGDARRGSGWRAGR